MVEKAKAGWKHRVPGKLAVQLEKFRRVCYGRALGT
jgi:hypothetical protein